MKKFDIAVVIGRFQPVHNAHLSMLEEAGKLANKVIIILGSAKKPRSYKNPWTSIEREEMLYKSTQSLSNTTGAVYCVEHNIDTIYNDQAWAIRVQELVSKHSKASDRIAIVGHRKDSSSYYLDFFPQWEEVNQPLIETLNATDIRRVFFTPEICNFNWFKGVLPAHIIDYLKDFKNTDAYEAVVREKAFIEKYRKQYDAYPYPPTFVTADAVVIKAGHVLLVQRGADPGNGLWALPGGFLDANTDRSVLDAAIRELYEETSIRVPERVMRGSLHSSRVFDAIDRSARGRTITHAFTFLLQEKDHHLPKVRGQENETSDVKWIPVSNITSDMMFEDHYDIITWAVNS